VHQPVLLSEVVELLAPEQGGVFVDATLGFGGHTEALLNEAEEAGVKIQVLGMDQDQEALRLAHERLGERIEYVWRNFAQLIPALKERGICQVDGILMDIGVSSMQIDTAERGFSYQENGPLDMRMDQTISITAASILNTWPEHRLATLFWQYGEERLSKKIARAIVEDRRKDPFYETKALSELLVRLYPAHLRYKRPHPATRVFQALRIEVNRELAVLEDGMKAALEVLAPGGRLVIITFHSLEDRIVKYGFREAVATGEFELLNKKPLTASDEEQELNSRSRSAKVRGITRLRN
jgi:16S rRNA (cytosine1402-N4)-methyltransferase